MDYYIDRDENGGLSYIQENQVDEFRQKGYNIYDKHHNIISPEREEPGNAIV